jgi:hypothetical protein
MTKRNKRSNASEKTLPKPAFVRCRCGRNYPAGDCKCGASAVEGKCRCGRDNEKGSFCGCVFFPACCDEFMCDGEEDYEIL